MRQLLFLFCFLLAAVLAGRAQDMYPGWPVPEGEYEVYIEPDFNVDGIYYCILPERDHEVGVMNNHPLGICVSCDLSEYFEGLGWYVSDTYSGDVTVPSTVTHDGETYRVTMVMYGAFAKSTGLRSVTLPESVTEMRPGAFAACTSLTSVTFPSSIRRLPDATFLGCTGIRTLDLSRFEDVWDYAITGCTKFETLIISGAEHEFCTLSCRWRTRLVMGVETEMIGSIKDVYVVRPEAADVDCGYYEPFLESELASATLHVPEGCADRFRQSESWGKFANIVEGAYSGISDKAVTPADVVRCVEGGLSFGGGDAPARVYDVSGHQVGVLSASSPELRLPRGIYLVSTSGATVKVVVR
jgi:hypothetical protein